MRDLEFEDCHQDENRLAYNMLRNPPKQQSASPLSIQSWQQDARHDHVPANRIDVKAKVKQLMKESTSLLKGSSHDPKTWAPSRLVVKISSQSPWRKAAEPLVDMFADQVRTAKLEVDNQIKDNSQTIYRVSQVPVIDTDPILQNGGKFREEELGIKARERAVIIGNQNRTKEGTGVKPLVVDSQNHNIRDFVKQFYSNSNIHSDKFSSLRLSSDRKKHRLLTKNQSPTLLEYAGKQGEGISSIIRQKQQDKANRRDQKSASCLTIDHRGRQVILRRELYMKSKLQLNENLQKSMTQQLLKSPDSLHPHMYASNTNENCIKVGHTMIKFNRDPGRPNIDKKIANVRTASSFHKRKSSQSDLSRGHAHFSPISTSNSLRTLKLDNLKSPPEEIVSKDLLMPSSTIKPAKYRIACNDALIRLPCQLLSKAAKSSPKTKGLASNDSGMIELLRPLN